MYICNQTFDAHAVSEIMATIPWLQPFTGESGSALSAYYRSDAFVHALEVRYAVEACIVGVPPIDYCGAGA